MKLSLLLMSCKEVKAGRFGKKDARHGGLWRRLYRTTDCRRHEFWTFYFLICMLSLFWLQIWVSAVKWASKIIKRWEKKPVQKMWLLEEKSNFSWFFNRPDFLINFLKILRCVFFLKGLIYSRFSNTFANLHLSPHGRKVLSFLAWA